MVGMHAVILSKMTSKTTLLQLLLLAVTALCYSVDAFSASSSRGSSRITTHSSSCSLNSPQTRLFQSSSTTASHPILTRKELDADIIINTINSSGNDTVSLTTKSPQEEQHHAQATATTTKAATTDKQLIPSTWSQALHHFFLKDIGPPLVVLTISAFISTRIQLLATTPFSITELSIFSSAILLWWVQEYIFHRVLLHSPFNWIGKSIHATHHDKDYFHISIDPPALLLGWLFTAHFLIKGILPQYHLCLTATIGYSLAGLVYEWSHYIVHTKVKPRLIPKTCPSYKELSFVERWIVQPLMRGYAKTRDNHIRHHLIDDRYWYAFSVVEMDDLFGTNPGVKEVKRELKEKKREGKSSREGFQ